LGPRDSRRRQVQTQGGYTTPGSTNKGDLGTVLVIEQEPRDSTTKDWRRGNNTRRTEEAQPEDHAGSAPTTNRAPRNNSSKKMANRTQTTKGV